MKTMALVNEWGPAILVCLPIVVGVVFQNKRLDDTNARISDLRSEIDGRLSDFRAHLDTRIDDLRDLVKSEIGRLEKRIESLESPLAKR
jgi:archaellum component FlaC